MLVEVVVGFVSLLLFLYVIDVLNRRSTKLDGAHALVTGGSSGIGKALAKQLAQNGASITLLARNKTKLAEAKEEVEKHLAPGRRVLTFSVDLSHGAEAVEAVINKACASLGPVDVLVNCAGYSECAVFEETKVEVFKNMIDTNYLGSVYPTYAVIKSMKKRCQGHVVFVSSIAGQFGIFGLSAYCASKFAIRGFAESLLMEVKPYNVGVSVVFPPDTDTPGFENENKNKPEETKLICSSGGLFNPEDVARGIIEGVQSRRFLISCGLDGWAVKTVTCGAAPSSSWIELLTQVSLMGLLRLVMVSSLSGFDRIAKNGKAKRDAS